MRQTKRARKREFFDVMGLVMKWAKLVSLIASYALRAKTGRLPCELATMLRTYFFPQCFGLSDLAVEEVLFEPPHREFAGLSSVEQIPDLVGVLCFRHMLEEHKLVVQVLTNFKALLADKGLMLREGMVVDASLIAAPSSTKQKGCECDPEMHETKKGSGWHFGLEVHSGIDADSGLVHVVVGTVANGHDVTQANRLVHCEATDAFAHTGHQGAA